MDGGDIRADAAARARGGRKVALADRYDLAVDDVLLSGVQALLRAAAAQVALDAAAGRDVEAYVTGYRGSPLGGLDAAAARAGDALRQAGVRFEPGLNEDVAATALWGAQTATARPGATKDGVAGLWYGKGPGVDRSGDALRHANLAGVARWGGVVAAAGDDHTCESSTTCHQSDFAFVDAQIPVLHPAGPQEVFDYALLGWSLSRASGLWVGLKCLKDTVEATTVVDARTARLPLAPPTPPAPPEGLHLLLGESPQDQERRLIEWRVPAFVDCVAALGLDRRTHGAADARLGIVAAGKSWLDVVHALDLLGIDQARAHEIGVGVYKPAAAWPLEPQGARRFARGLKTLLVVEEKRPLIEEQLRSILYGAAADARPEVIGKRDQDGAPLLSARLDFDAADVALALAKALARIDALDPDVAERAARIQAARARQAIAPAAAERRPAYCAGCPHNRSTKAPDGARNAAGIGCHYMALWMDRGVEGHTHMGGEGAQWIGEAPYARADHIFQNMGDGTFNHSGLMSVRAAAASSANITFKILYNDAVALTGGQLNDGGLTPKRVAEELLAAGCRKVVAVVDPNEPPAARRMPLGVSVRPREKLADVERALAKTPGATAILYVQTCAAEKRRRRRKGLFPEPARRVTINEALCEGCGDCGVASNCVAIKPLDTPLGVKRRIDQSSCNQDLTCLEGLCPALVSVAGAEPATATVAADAALDAAVARAAANPVDIGADGRKTYGILISGVGGTGVVTLGAVLAMAAHIEGKGAGVIEMAGLAQKGGAVRIHVRLAERPRDVSAIRIASGEADLAIVGDAMVGAGAKSLGAMSPARTRLVCATDETVTGDFARDPTARVDAHGLAASVRRLARPDAALAFDASALAERRLGDAIYANMVLLGAAWSRGWVPLERDAILEAIALNGAAVAQNRAAFALGAAVADDPTLAEGPPSPPEPNLDDVLAERSEALARHSNAAWAARYRDAVAAVAGAEAAVAPGDDRLARAAAEGLFKLMSYKDEYEVARIHAATTAEMVAARFARADGRAARPTFHLAPPLLPLGKVDGRPRKIAVGAWARPVFAGLARLKALRGGPFDAFGWTAERRAERAWVDQHEADLYAIARRLSPERLAFARELAALPLTIRGFGAVKERAAAAAAVRRATLLAEISAAPELWERPAADQTS